jgi:hypothetical protein
MINFFSKYLVLSMIAALPIPTFASDTKPAITSEEQALKEPGTCFFIPPKNWRLVDQKHLLEEVKIMVVGLPLSMNHIPPSINLALEETSLSTDQYLAIVEENNKSDPDCYWTNIGFIQTNAGPMVLTQLDLKTSYGPAKMIQAIMVKHSKAYVLTATSAQSEFAHFSDDFNQSIKSFTINKDIFELVDDKKKRKDLKNFVKQVKNKWSEDLRITKSLYPDLSHSQIAIKTFDSSSFQNIVWKPLQEKIASSYDFLGSKWADKFFSILKDDLLSIDVIKENS